MGLTAREWIWLPRDEQERRKGELSQHECFLLRTRYDDVHPTEKEKASLTQEAKERMLQKPSEEEIRKSKESDLKVMKMSYRMEKRVILSDFHYQYL